MPPLAMGLEGIADAFKGVLGDATAARVVWASLAPFNGDVAGTQGTLGGEELG